MKNKYHTVGTIKKSNIKRGKIGTPNTQLHNLSFSWLVQALQKKVMVLS
jgi:hypothetical protein